MRFKKWAKIGLENGWIVGDSWCYFHDGPNFTDEEEQQLEETGETSDCVICVRLNVPF